MFKACSDDRRGRHVRDHGPGSTRRIQRDQRRGSCGEGSGDQAAYLANVRKLAAFTPGHPSIQIALARGLALDGDRAGAVAQLNRMADLGLSFGAADDAAFQSLKDDPAFVAAAQRLADNGKGSGRNKGIIKLGLTGGSEGVA